MYVVYVCMAFMLQDQDCRMMHAVTHQFSQTTCLLVIYFTINLNWMYIMYA